MTPADSALRLVLMKERAAQSVEVGKVYLVLLALTDQLTTIDTQLDPHTVDFEQNTEDDLQRHQDRMEVGDTGLKSFFDLTTKPWSKANVT